MNIRGVEITWRQIGVLSIVWLAFLLSFVDRLAWPPVMPVAAKDLGLSAKQAGSYMTAFYTGYVVTQLPGGLLTDRFGYRKVLLGSFILMGLFTALMSTVTNYEQGFICRILAGIGSGSIFSASVRAIFDWFPPKGRGTAMGIFMTSTSLGLSVVNLFVPVVAKQYSWQAAFMVSGAFPLIALLIALPLLKERTTSDDRAQSQAAANFWRDVLSLTHNKNLMITAASGFCAMWATWGTATWANTYMNKGLNISLVEAGAIMSLYGAAALFCKPISGILADIFGGKKKILLFIMLASFVPALITFGLNKSVLFLYFLTPLLGIVAFIYSPVMNTFIGELVRPNLVGTATGFVNTIWQLGSLISPLAVGAVLDATHSYLNAFITLALGPAIGALIILGVRERSEANEVEDGNDFTKATKVQSK